MSYVWLGHIGIRPQLDWVQYLTHWGQVTHICVGNLTIIGSDNGLSPGRRQAITWTNVGILLIGPLGTNFSEMLIEIHTFSFKKIHLKMSSGKWRPFCLSLNVLIASHPSTGQNIRAVQRGGHTGWLWSHLLIWMMGFLLRVPDLVPFRGNPFKCVFWVSIMITCEFSPKYNRCPNSLPAWAQGVFCDFKVCSMFQLHNFSAICHVISL